MAILRLRQPLKGKTGGQGQHRFDASTVEEVLHVLEREYPDVRGWILDERGRLRRHINIYVNGEPGDQHSPVGTDDQIDVLPAISGGGLT